MADRAEFFRPSSGASVNALSSAQRKASMRIVVVIALVALVLAGCNSTGAVNPSSQQNLANIYPNYSAYNPIQYAQTSGFYGGR
jgi:hypothetical protein